MESDVAAAREQLSQIDEAKWASVAASVQPLPGWFFPLFALVGPAAIWWTTFTDDRLKHEYGTLHLNLLRFGAAAMIVVAVAAIGFAWRSERATAVVRPKAPALGGHTSRWVIFGILAITMSLNVGIAFVSISAINQPHLIGGLLYLWLAFMPGYFWRRHIEAMADKRP